MASQPAFVLHLKISRWRHQGRQNRPISQNNLANYGKVKECVWVCVSVRRQTLTLPPFLPYLDWATKEEQDVPVIHTLHFNWVFRHPRLPIIITALVQMTSPADLPALQYNCLCVFVLLCDRELCSEAHTLSGLTFKTESFVSGTNSQLCL